MFRKSPSVDESGHQQIEFLEIVGRLTEVLYDIIVLKLFQELDLSL
jgi:hypothetical protein